jgi:triacylglycerol lipase
MSVIAPNVAARIALLSYQIEKKSKRLPIHNKVKQHFKFNVEDVQQGTSGGFFWRETTGFLLIGQGHSQQHKGDHVIAIRGTASLADAVTDITAHSKSNDAGSLVHTGFQTTFESFRDGLAEYLNKPEVLKSTGIIHCVGHSLGGALATLVANWVKAKYNKTVYLYTFGCPRVGYKDFAIKSSARIDKVYRCVHGSDPVPKVPVWPFCHVHINGSEYVPVREQGLSPKAHSMETAPGYVNSTNYAQWDDMYSQIAGSMYQRVVLNYENRLQTTYSSHWADKIAAALMTLIIDGGGTGLIAAIQAGGTTIATAYDLMAKFVCDLANIVGFEEQLKGLLGHMIVFAGKPAVTVIKYTLSFIKWVFNITLGRLYDQARNAMKNV